MVRDRSKLQMIVSQKEDLLTIFFRRAFEYLDADKGLLSFVDSQDHLRILVQVGEYLHLPAGRGISGVAFKTGKTIITKPNEEKGATPFRGSGDEIVYSEIAAPITLGDEVVGVFLFDSLRKDKHFDQHGADYLEDLGKKVEAALEEKDPWRFRSWWAKEQKKKRRNILERTKDKLKGPLRDEFAKHSDIDIKVAEVNENGIAGPYETLLESTEESITRSSVHEGHDERDPLIRSIQQGKAVYSVEKVLRHRCYIPFPPLGPVVGIIKIESGVEGLLNQERMDKVIAELDKIPNDPLAVSEPDAVNENFFLNFVHRATKAHLTALTFSKVIERVAEDVTRLCGSDVNIYCSAERHRDLASVTYQGQRFHMMPLKELRTSFPNSTFRNMQGRA